MAHGSTSTTPLRVTYNEERIPVSTGMPTWLERAEAHARIGGAGSHRERNAMRYIPLSTSPPPL